MVRKSSRECFIQTYLTLFSSAFLSMFDICDCTQVEEYFPSDQITLSCLKQGAHFGISACGIFFSLSIYSQDFYKLFKC